MIEDLSPDSSLEPYRADYGCGYPVKRLFELLELQTRQFDLQLHPMALQPQSYSRCLCLPLFGSAAKVHDGSSINWSSILEFDLIVIFSGRVGGAPVWRKMERKKKKQDGGWKRGMGAGFVKLSYHQIILLLLFYFSSFLNMYCYYLSFVIIILYRIYVYVKIIVYNNHILTSYSNENF